MLLKSTGMIQVAGVSLEYRWIEAKTTDAPALIFLHEGLGCVGMWKDFPDQVAQTTGWGAFVYSRAGYGKSGPAPLPRSVRYMHHEGLVVLPQLIKTVGFQKFFLIGHSDGGSIALVYAGSAKKQGLCGLALMAPHVFNESICVQEIQQAGEAYKTTNLREKLVRYHGAQTDETFWGWHDIWLHADFWHWNLEEYLPAIEVPSLVIQGEEDRYGTLRQVETIQNQVSGLCTKLILPACGHSPYREQRATVHQAITSFIKAPLSSAK